MNGVNQFIFCYNIKVVALFKCLVSSVVSSGVSLNVMVFMFLGLKFATDLTLLLY